VGLIAEFGLYAGISILCGWWSPSIFLKDSWPRKVRIAVRASMSVLLFILFGVYHRATGESVADTVEQFTICPIFKLAHCSPADGPGRAEYDRAEEIMRGGGNPREASRLMCEAWRKGYPPAKVFAERLDCAAGA
jgi:hypothetical protein